MFDYLARLARHGHVDPVEFYTSDDHRAVYVENAKVACTAIKAAMFPREALSATGQDDLHRRLRPLATHRLPTRARDYLVFTFVRHPVDRLRSCYADKVGGQAAHAGPSILQRRFHRGIFLAFAGVDPARELAFDGFAEAVSHIPDRLSDRHFASQSRIVAAVEAAPRHFVGRLERLDRDWERVRAATGLPALVVANRSASPCAGADRTDGSHPAIARRYANDFARLGYVA